VALSEILRPQSPREYGSQDVVGPSEYDKLQSRIRQAYLAVTSDRINTRARLCDVRERLSDVDRTALDEVLKKMQREQQISLYPLDNKAEIADADRKAAIYFSGEPRHILWIER